MGLNDSKGANKNRNRLNIVRDMLTEALTKARKTRIMYRANLSFLQAEKYLKVLLERGLVEYDGNYFYSVTGKGKEFLRIYDDYVEQCRRVNEEADETVKRRLLLESMCFKGDCSGTQSTIKRNSRGAAEASDL